MPNVTDKRARRIREARISILTAAAVQLGTAALLLWGRSFLPPEHVLAWLLLAAAALTLAALIPMGIVYRKRIQEIEGGEEDAAGEY